MDDANTGLGVVASKEALRTVRQFFLKLLGPTAEQFGLMGGDWARAWRIRNLLAINEKCDRIFQEKGIDAAEGRHLSLAVGLPLLEKASYHDNDFLQERWAHLITSSLHSEDQAESSFSLDTTYVEILNQLSQLDCEVLEFIVENGVKSSGDNGITVRLLDPDEIQTAHPNKPSHISLEKLTSLGCARFNPKIPLKTGGQGLMEVVTPTIIGINLYIAASGKTPKGMKGKTG